MKIFAANIDWDVDDDELKKTLPKKVEIDENFIGSVIGEYLSDNYDFCFNGYTLEVEE